MTQFRAMLIASSVLFATAAIADQMAAVEQLRVVADQSTLLHLDHPAKTVIVGNAAIADVQLINDRTIYVLGRTFGNTNIIAVDEDGGEVLNRGVTVTTPDDQQVTLWRGPRGQRNLACAPFCERTVTVGDPDMTTVGQDADRKVESGQKAAQMSKQ